MAYQDQFYTLGTVSVEEGSPAVVGSGTGWETALVTSGVFYADGAAYPILSVESETNLTLAIPYIGATASDLVYAIDRQRSEAVKNVAMNDRLAQIIREITIGNIEQLNGLVLGARQILQTDEAGKLKLIGLQSNKALVTNASGDVTPISIGTLGRALLALATGTTDQYLQGDGTLQAKTGLPISTAVQNALNAKVSASGLMAEIAARTQVGNVGGLGTYAFCQNNTGITLTPGQGSGGTGISYASQAGSPGQTPPGNWICMGRVNNGDRTVFFRYS